MADEEAIDSIFEKSQEKDEKISFILVVHATPDLKPDPGNLDQFEGHYKIPLDKVGDFWEIVSCKHFNMGLLAPEKKGGFGGAGFSTMY